MKKKLLSMLVSFMMIFNLFTPFASYAEETTETQENYIVFDVEKFILGLGYVQEPILVPFEEGQNCAQILANTLDEECIEYKGSLTSGFYLSRIFDGDDTEIDGYSKGRTKDGWLGEFDYTSDSGWMYCMNSSFPNLGMDSYKPKNGDVMRVQFTANGYGADIGEGFSGSAAKVANKDKLATALANINSASNKNKLLNYKNLRAAYKKANDVMAVIEASQSDVDKATTELNEAVANIESDTTAKPIKGVTLNKPEEMKIGKTFQLTATIVPSDTTDDKTVTWKTSNSKVATVDNNGLITAIGEGTCKIYAYVGDYKSSVTVTVTEDQGVSDDFVIENGVLTEYKGSEEEVTIPNTVTSIADGVFKNNKTIKKVTIPDTVTSMGESVFAYCTALTTANIPNGMTTIPKSTFSGSTALTNVTIPESVTVIGQNAFYNCKGLRSIKFPSKLTTIESSAFCYSGISNLDFPDSLESIGSYAFSQCSSLPREITLPSSLKTISRGLFKQCLWIKSINIPTSVEKIEGDAFNGCKYLKSIKVIGKTYDDENVIDLSNVTTLHDNVFYDNQSIEKVLLNDKLSSINMNTFYNCTSLKEIQLPKELTQIKTKAFYNCTSLKTLSLSKTVTSVAKDIVTKATSLTDIFVEEGNENYQDLNGVLFTKAGALVIYPEGKTSETLVLPEGGTTLDRFTNNYIKKIVVPASATIAFGNPYSDCPKLESIEVADGSKSFKSIDGVLYSLKDEKIKDLVTYPAARPGDEYTIVDGCTNLASDAFTTCTILKTLTIPSTLEKIGYGIGKNSSVININIPDGITEIAKNAFSNCSSIKNINIPESVKTIGNNAFGSCSSLESIAIPKSVKSIGDRAFAFCYKLKEVKVYSKDVTMGENCFTSVDNDITLYGYPKSTIEEYAKANNLNFVAFDAVTVKFDADNGEEAEEQIVLTGEEALDYTPEAPTKEGYTFVGWYKDTDDVTTEYKSGLKYTEDVTYKAKYAHVTMLGAQGKLVADDKSGIRFGTKLYNDGDEIVEKGTLILPANLLDEGEYLTLDTPKVAKSVAKVNYEVNKDENYVTYLGTIVNIPKAQFHRQMTAAAYVIYKDKAGNQYTVYSQYPNESTSVYDILGNNVGWNDKWNETE